MRKLVINTSQEVTRLHVGYDTEAVRRSTPDLPSMLWESDRSFTPKDSVQVKGNSLSSVLFDCLETQCQ